VLRLCGGALAEVRFFAVPALRWLRLQMWLLRRTAYSRCSALAVDPLAAVRFFRRTPLRGDYALAGLRWQPSASSVPRLEGLRFLAVARWRLVVAFAAVPLLAVAPASRVGPIRSVSYSQCPALQVDRLGSDSVGRRVRFDSGLLLDRTLRPELGMTSLLGLLCAAPSLRKTTCARRARRGRESTRAERDEERVAAARAGATSALSTLDVRHWRSRPMTSAGRCSDVSRKSRHRTSAKSPRSRSNLLGHHEPS